MCTGRTPNSTIFHRSTWKSRRFIKRIAPWSSPRWRRLLLSPRESSRRFEPVDLTSVDRQLAPAEREMDSYRDFAPIDRCRGAVATTVAKMEDPAAEEAPLVL